MPGDVERIWLETSGGLVETWFLEADLPDSTGPVMIFTHGNAELIDHWPAEFREARQAGVHVLLVDRKSVV